MSMILFTVAESRDCEYCAAQNEFACRSLGIDEETLSALAEDLDNVSPERIRATIAFALKVSHDPLGIDSKDYELLREHAITDEEIVEIAVNAAGATFFDILADSLKVEVEPAVAKELGR
jgi:alkylhydroperoxidase family enzyme